MLRCWSTAVVKDESKSDVPAALLSREQTQCQNKSGRRLFPSVLQTLAPRDASLPRSCSFVAWIDSGTPQRASDSSRTLALAKSGVRAPVILPSQNYAHETNEGPAKGHKLCKMPNQSISEAECKRLAQVLEPKALPARISV